MSSRYRYFRDVWNEDVQHTQKGFPDIDLYTYFNFSDDRLYKIPLKYEYRPDLIAMEFYQNPKLYWVLVYANGFNNSPQDFVVNSIIKTLKEWLL